MSSISISFQIRLPLENLWCQNRQSITIEFKMDLAFHVEEKNMYLRVEPDSVDFEYTDIIYSGLKEYYVLYRNPTLKLFGIVDPQKTQIKYLQSSIKVCLVFIGSFTTAYDSYKAVF